jgi:hypothetical protein
MDIKPMEEWREVLASNGRYWVSNLGQIKSKFKVVKSHLDKHGYLIVRFKINKKQKNMFVHRLVAEAFIKNPLNLPQVNHIDFNRANNELSNLEWVDCKTNVHHSVSAGRIGFNGGNNFNSKLTQLEVDEIRDLDRSTPKQGKQRKKGFLIFLSDKYKVEKHTILNVLKYKSWK